MPVLPTTRLIAPCLPLASCVRAYLSRSTLDAPLLPPGQRLNRFPATPLCGVSFLISGDSELAAPGLGLEIKMPPVLFSGPQSKPMVSYNPGPAHSFWLLFYPAALHKLTGLDISAQLDKFYAPGEIFDAAWLALFEQVLRAPDDETRVALIEAFIEPRWRQVRELDGSDSSLLGDWVRRLGVQAAGSSWGNGARNVERRIKAWAGQPMRTLRRLRRAEQVFLESRDEFIAGTISWTDIAARGGYADQAHLCREARQITGLSPAELMKARQADQSYWVYQIWS